MPSFPAPSVVVVAGPIRPADVPELCDRVRAARRGDGGDIVCDVSGVTATDLATVDALARMQLAARRAGGRIRLRDPSPRLALLLSLTGLGDALGIEPLGDPEEREPPLGEVQEAVETGDPTL
ncbi:MULTISPECIES: STAS domain-containing protein [unclassified Streptomyces]|uniref:STAS domain-containing protein n=1 Tax=unclassified Streptomyces TaxID=2593676 RepID=UPI000DBA81EA|nr:STAS domain-containing protein [Streptomyces sp. PsTaAH-137]MYT68718.1 STAS domain-containing protein [Streptomyces sp. SID8367]RAJ86391.1 anti-anti-sigma regulatory factor [Streptomyces sp. PsTaAH-137]